MGWDFNPWASNGAFDSDFIDDVIEAPHQEIHMEPCSLKNCNRKHHPNHIFCYNHWAMLPHELGMRVRRWEGIEEASKFLEGQSQ